MKNFCTKHLYESSYYCPHCEAEQYREERDVLRHRVMDLEKESWDLRMTTDAANCLADGAIELAKEREDLKLQIEELQKRHDNCQNWRYELEMEVHQLRTKLRDLSTPDVWVWIGDGNDDLDSMGENMTIKIRAEDLRALLERPEISGVF